MDTMKCELKDRSAGVAASSLEAPKSLLLISYTSEGRDSETITPRDRAAEGHTQEGWVMGGVCSVRRAQLPFVACACGGWGVVQGVPSLKTPPTQQTDL